MRTNTNGFRKPFVLMAGLLLLAGTASAAAQEMAQPQDNATQPAQQQEAAPHQEMAPASPTGEHVKGFSLRVDPLVLGVMRSHVDTNSAKWEEYRDMSNG